MSLRYRHAPVSMRHAFALALDLAVRRDSFQSLILPLVLRTPWVLALALLPAPEDSDDPARVMVLRSVAMLGDYLLLLLVTGMLRFRARSVFNTLPNVHPAPALECYALGARRLPWLFLTEVLRYFAVVLAVPFLVLPAIFLAFRLSFATEAVVLNEPNTAAAFSRSFRLTEARFERWLEMIVTTVVLSLTVFFSVALVTLLVPGLDMTSRVAIAWLAATAVTPIIQYAWTFFYLRLVEVDHPGVEVGPAYAGGPGGAGEPGAPPPGAATAPEAATGPGAAHPA